MDHVTTLLSIPPANGLDLDSMGGDFAHESFDEGLCPAMGKGVGDGVVKKDFHASQIVRSLRRACTLVASKVKTPKVRGSLLHQDRKARNP